ncbi:MAG: Nif3-like dinuclear metal center hexameric protein [Clostridiales bacterium]|nr:Nif3-like dinuclear metal center hexameric protein [Clostridiales bacterium]
MSLKQITVETIFNWLNEVAPFETQEEFDNAGLQVGLMAASVSKVLLALDVTEAVVMDAVHIGAELIIAHHPLIFMPLRDMQLDKHVPGLLALMIKHNINLIAVHTNIDQSMDYSASAAVAGLLGLRGLRKQGNYLFIGELPEALSALELQILTASTLHVPARLYGDPQQRIHTLAIAGGAYSEGFEEALASGADALLTGEVKHHHAVEAAARGFVLLDGGHYATEQPMMQPLALGLQSMADTVKYNLQVYVSRDAPYSLQTTCGEV